MAKQDTLNAMNYTLIYSQYAAPTMGVKTAIFALVLAAHFAIMSVWQSQGDTQVMSKNQLSVSFAMNHQAAQPARPPQAARPLPPKSVPAPMPVTTQEIAGQTAAAPAEVATPAPAIADIEPDYKAAYLNNPPPAYPMVARRNGMQGRVMLNVEVLAGGLCGKINIHKSSGHAMLDEAALQTVRNWRFVPARHAGQSVDKWFIIPVQFSLRDHAA